MLENQPGLGPEAYGRDVLPVTNDGIQLTCLGLCCDSCGVRRYRSACPASPFRAMSVV